MSDKMRMYGFCVILLAVFTHVTSVSLTLDEDARQQCKKYKMMCKSHEVCAIQRFTEPSITMPVCIPRSYIPGRNHVCHLAPVKGSCQARFTRWHYNIHHQGCTHFTYSGCGSNGNNFMTREECEKKCLRTPTIQLIDGGSVKPAIMTAPEYKPPAMNKYEALNSIMMSSPEYESGYDRFQMMKQRNNRNKPYSEVSTRKRRRLIEKERAAKEKRRRERRKERRRLRKLKKRRKRKEKKRGLKKKKKSGKKNKKKKAEITPLTENETTQETNPDDEAAVMKAVHDAEIVEEAEEIVNREIQMLEDEEEAERIKKEKRKERKRKKRRQRRKKRRLDRNKKTAKRPKYAELRGKESTIFKRIQILDKEDSEPQANSIVQTVV